MRVEELLDDDEIRCLGHRSSRQTREEAQLGARLLLRARRASAHITLAPGASQAVASARLFGAPLVTASSIVIGAFFFCFRHGCV
jgi:hypothetical protein